MRFILNFIFYGVLFYLIYLAFPDFFFTMVSWAEKISELLRDLYMQLAAKVHDWRWQRGGTPPPPEHAQLIFLWLIAKCSKR
jgi:hypothetical protein